MGPSLPVDEILARLETKIAYHKEQGEAHARQEAAHAEQREMHETEHRKALERYETLKAASAAAGEMVVGAKPLAPLPAELPKALADGRGPWIARLMEMVLETKLPGEVFGATSLIAEIEARWGAQLRHGIDPRSAAATLRRWAAKGVLDVVSKGRAHHEGQYAKPG